MALPVNIQRDLDRANAFLNPPQEAQVVPPNPPAVQAEATQVQPPAPTPAAPPAPNEDWEHKYKTLQGVHNRHTADLKGRIGQLEDQLQHLLQQSRQPAAAPATSNAPEVNSQDAEVFGQDLVEMVRRQADGLAGNTIRTLETRIAQLEQQLAGASAVASKTADEVFYERLTQLVPDWEAVNKDEDFLNWLAEIDPMYGQPRQQALTSAGNARDVTRVATVFNTYKGTVPEPPKQASRQQPQVSPRTSGNGANPQVPAGPQTITIQQVEAFYKDVQLGKYRGREEVMAREEAVINAALAENRIVDARQGPRRV
jgi:hypothetical protein